VIAALSLVVLLGGPGPSSAARAIDDKHIPTVAVAERLTLARRPGPLTLVFEALDARVELRTGSGSSAAAVASSLLAHASRICPEVSMEGPRVLLHCRSPRIDAKLVREGQSTYLDLFELRGLPYRSPSDRISVMYDPVLTGLGGPCPGDTPSARGECALAAGDRATAVTHLRSALGGIQRPHAALRLGDIALADGDVPGAVGWYASVRAPGPFGRLAASRLCELGGACFNNGLSITFDAGGMPEPVASELRLRWARMMAFLGRTREVAAPITTILAGPYASLCETIAPLACRRVVLAALRSPEIDGSSEILEAFLTLPNHVHGPYAMELAQAAAEKATRAGAPVFGGNLLAAVAGEVPDDRLPDHLLRAAELFVAGNELARASLIVDYAGVRMARRQVGPRWAAVRGQVKRWREEDVSRSDALSESDFMAAEVTTELARALGAMARARTEAP
jgi:hypothetical protein